MLPLLLVGVMGLPILWLAFAAMVSGSNGLAAAMLPTALRETTMLMLSVGFMTGVLGLVAAWLVTHFEFAGRRLFDWALILPLAVPTYLAAYTYVEFLGFTGPPQQLVRLLFGGETLRDYWFPDIRSDWGASLVFSMVLYPYVYASCRAFFLMQSASLDLAARTLGASRARTFFSVTLPISRPAIVVGVTLAMMEVVNDLGAVQYFGVNSLTAIIYSTWINRADFGGAAQLAVTIVLVIALLILLERAARRDRVYQSHRDSRVPPGRERLRGGWAAMASLYCTLLFALGFGVPFGQLAYLALRRVAPENVAMTLNALWPTLVLATAGALATVAVGLVAARQSRGPAVSRGAIKLATLGYAIPGTVLALGLLQPLGQVDLWTNRATTALFDWRPGLIVSGSMLALVYVYAIRFLAVSHSTLDEAMRKRGDNMLLAGRVLGARGLGLLLRIDLPTLTPALLSAATLVFVEIVKELPATLLLRPLGVDTLATVVYSHANVSLFVNAALPALFIVLAGLVPVILATRFGSARKL
ncbi:iron ABC transporter permease [Devosia nitrariae]|uniref:Iron ABC transporter permease n=2 Tax=Devosia nitrariae TaxID=2071872 RepID=A0ABQ5VZ18_9HYPH|nr:iron ABC transporter permease [Devosia nitrariae]